MSLGKDAMLALLKTYETAYYSGESKVSDEEYDSLKAMYIEQYGEYDFVPNEGEVEHFQKVKHLYPLKSLDKYQINNEEGIRKELKRLWPVIIQPKFDGLSIEIRYVQNTGLRFITRGDGEIGDDVTAQCKQIIDVEYLENLFINCNQSFRAEILMTHSAFKAINNRKSQDGEELLSNCRNGAAGMLRNKDLSKIEGLTIMLYEDLSSVAKESVEINSMNEVLKEYDVEDSIRITPYYEPKDIDEAIRYLKELESYRESIDYDIDGWVVKSNIVNSLQVHGGYTGHHPKNAFAVKGEAKGAWTTIKSVTWQVGKEYITPVAELEPVEIDGSTISRCTLHNVGFLKAIGLDNICYKGKYEPISKVKVIKANDVIPRIIEIKHADVLENNIYTKSCFPPSKCPVCGGDTAIKESASDSEILICTNDYCSAKLQKKIEQLCSRDGLNIVGMSEGTIKKILDVYEIKGPSEILAITVEELLELEGFAKKSAEKLYNSIQKAIKEQSVDKILYAASIPLIGRSASKEICKNYTSNELLKMINTYNKEDFIAEFCKLKDFGYSMAESFYNHKYSFMYIAAEIFSIKDIKANKPTNSDIKQLVFCITGQREPFKTIIEKAGHKVSGSVSKNTNCLIATPGQEASSKYKKAQELNIPIINNEEDLMKMLNQ